MHKITDIRHLHLEISSRCNASCPMCARNLYGYPYNDGYIERDLTLADVKKIFDENFVRQLDKLLINGNFGDIVMNPESADIVEYFRSLNQTLEISISTNGGARNRQFWQKLAKLNCIVWFCIDGLEDTNHRYRQNVVWSTVIENAQTFISAGGTAYWRMIDFDFNRDQQTSALELSKQMGFKNFHLINEGRNSAPVFDKKGKLLHTIGNPPETKFQKILFKRKTDTVLLEDIDPRDITPISCWAEKNRSIYVNSIGEVYPCCYTGFQPRTYGHGNYMQVVNTQLNTLIKNNNALEFPLEQCIEWFSAVEQSWNKDSFADGRLVVCQDKCGTVWQDNQYITL